MHVKPGSRITDHRSVPDQAPSSERSSPSAQALDISPNKQVVIDRVGADESLRHPREKTLRQDRQTDRSATMNVATSEEQSPALEDIDTVVAETDRLIDELERSVLTDEPQLAPIAVPSAAASRADGDFDAVAGWLLAQGARSEQIELAFAHMPMADRQQMLIFCLLTGINLRPEDAIQCATMNSIPGFSGALTPEARLTYASLKVGGFTDEETASALTDGKRAKVKHFLLAEKLPAIDHEGTAKANYCALRALGYTNRNARFWAFVGPMNVGVMQRLGFDLEKFFKKQSTCEITPGTFPRFVGESVPGSRRELGKGGFNTVERLKIVDPQDGRKRQYAFKPSQLNPGVCHAGEICEIDERTFFPEHRNLAAVAVARVLGLTGDHGVIGEAFMGIVDGTVGLLMELAPGRPVANFDWGMRVDPASDLHRKLVKMLPMLRYANINSAQAKILGVHTISVYKDELVLTGSIAWGVNENNILKNNVNPVLKCAYARLQAFNWVVFDTDCHPGNILVDGDRVRRIDTDNAFARNSNPELHEDEWHLDYFLPMPPTHIDSALASLMCKPETRAELEFVMSLFDLPEEEDDAFLERFDILVERIETGDIEVIGTNDRAGWIAADMSDPAKHLFARDAQRPKPQVLASLLPKKPRPSSAN